MRGTGAAAADESRSRDSMVRRSRRARIGHPPKSIPSRNVVLAPDLMAPSLTSSLLASLVHELRTPVSALATGSELLLDDLDQLSREDL